MHALAVVRRRRSFVTVAAVGCLLALGCSCAFAQSVDPGVTGGGRHSSTLIGRHQMPTLAHVGVESATEPLHQRVGHPHEESCPCRLEPPYGVGAFDH